MCISLLLFWNQSLAVPVQKRRSQFVDLPANVSVNSRAGNQVALFLEEWNQFMCANESVSGGVTPKSRRKTSQPVNG